MAQNFYTPWRDTKDLRSGPMSWEVSSRAFLERLFLRATRQSKMEEFINHHQEEMIVVYYSLKSSKLCLNTYSLLSNTRNEMNYFVMGLSND